MPESCQSSLKDNPYLEKLLFVQIADYLIQ